MTRDAYTPLLLSQGLSPSLYSSTTHPTKMRQKTAFYISGSMHEDQSCLKSLRYRICLLLFSGYQFGRYFAILLKKNLVKLQVVQGERWEKILKKSLDRARLKSKLSDFL